MYNTEQKQQFLNTIVNENSYKAYTSAFNTIEEVETLLEKDICDMSLDEVLMALDMKSGKSYGSIKSRCSMYSSYVDWCIRNGKSILGENNLTKINFKSVEKSQDFVAYYFASDEDADKFISDSLYDEKYFDEVSTDEQRELIFRLLYMGMESDEIRELKISHIDFENSMIQSPIYDTINYKATERILKLCQNCHDMTEICIIRADKPAMLKVCSNNDYIFHPVVSKFRPLDYDGGVSKNYTWKKISEINERYEENTGNYKRATINSIGDSKKYYDYYMLNEDESFIDALKVDLMLRKPDRSEASLRNGILKFKNDYQFWKKAFHS